MRKPAREQGRNVHVESIALAHARASAKGYLLNNSPYDIKNIVTPDRAVF